MSAPGRKDPMKSFRGVMAAVLVLEAIVVLLALLVVAKEDDIAAWQGWLVGLLALAMLLACGVVGRPWGIYAAIGLQVVVAVVGFAVLPALGVVGLLFGAAWVWMLWLRNDVRRRMAQGGAP